MSRELAVLIKDDITQEPADETVYFGFDGKWYRLDLTSAHAEKYRAQLGYWEEYATEVPAPDHDALVTPAVSKREYNRAMREWAPLHGHDVPKLNKGGYFYGKQLQLDFAAAVERGEVTLS